MGFLAETQNVGNRRYGEQHPAVEADSDWQKGER
jgi:hypothetical protein